MRFLENSKKTIDIITREEGAKQFVIVEGVLYLLFLYLDFLKIYSEISNVLKYIAIWVCFIYVLFNFQKKRKKDILFMTGIMSFTVIADTFLLFSNQYRIGILSFIIVQILYSYRIKLICQDGCRKYMLEVLGVAFFWNLVILVLKNEDMLTPTVVIASLYFIIFTGNMIRMWGQVIRKKQLSSVERSLGIGLTLFYLCDIMVGLNYLNSTEWIKNEFMRWITECSGYFMWFFYLPSQVILSFHGTLYEKE